jgi:DNA-binding response OmpR family regulator
MPGKKVRSILLIDDDKDDYEMVVEALQLIDPSISVSFLDRCEDGIRYKNHVFDLVLLDINMPRHDGFSWLRGIREKGSKTLPVIMYTNSRSPANIMKAYDDGATLYYTKPERFEHLVKGLKELISLDWTNPFSITERYYREGKYSIFEVA